MSLAAIAERANGAPPAAIVGAEKRPLLSELLSDHGFVGRKARGNFYLG